MKIKNWKKLGKKQWGWRNTKNYALLGIWYDNTYPKPYILRLIILQPMKEWFFITGEEAEKFAIEYMKSNP